MFCPNTSTKTKLHPTILSIKAFMDHKTSPKPHVLLFPLPLPSIVNGMMKVAEMLCLSGINVTFLNTKYVQQRIASNSNVISRVKSYTTGLFKFETISDGLPDDHPRLIEDFPEMCKSLEAMVVPFLRERLKSSIRGEIEQPVTCVITEGYHYDAIDVAIDVGVPVFCYESISPSCLLSYLSLDKLVQEGEVPFLEKDMDKLVKSVPGMESFLRLRDLPIDYRNYIDDPNYKIVVNDANNGVQRANGVILNTFEDLDGPILLHIKSKIPNLYAIGPVHHHLQVKRSGIETEDSSSNSCWEEDDSCMKWLDGKAPKSVIFVSFGSLARITKAMLMEFWHGLVDSGTLFLWVIRPDSVIDENLNDNYLKQLQEDTHGKGYIVSWTSQEKILAHKSIGGFLTHSGWGSTLESIVEGVPMICWPRDFDQHPISRFVSEVWKLGFDMKDVCERSIIKTMVKDIIEEGKNEELRKQAEKMKHLARKSVSKGGSSSNDLERLVIDIICLSKIS